MVRFWLYFSYVLGILVHLLMSAQASARSSANGLSDQGVAVRGMVTWLKLNWISILFRLLVEIALFGYLIDNPQLITSYSILGVPLKLAWYLVVLLGLGVDAFFDSGFFILVKLLQDRIPLLKGVSIDIPSLVPPPAEPPKSDQAPDFPTGPPGTH
ncbi:MAG: hypothetical protein ACRD20_02290 [Terriglobales bacterium]